MPGFPYSGNVQELINRSFRPARTAIFAALMISGFTTGVKREPGANPGLFLKL